MAGLATFRILCSDLADVSDSDVETCLSLATLRMGDAVKWGSLYEMAAVYLTGHMLQTSRKAGAIGATIAVKTGDLSQGFAAGGVQQRPGLQSTTYGVEYLQIAKLCGIVGAVAVSGSAI